MFWCSFLCVFCPPALLVFLCFLHRIISTGSSGSSCDSARGHTSLPHSDLAACCPHPCRLPLAFSHACPTVWANRHLSKTWGQPRHQTHLMQGGGCKCWLFLLSRRLAVLACWASAALMQRMWAIIDLFFFKMYMQFCKPPSNPGWKAMNYKCCSIYVQIYLQH